MKSPNQDEVHLPLSGGSKSRTAHFLRVVYESREREPIVCFCLSVFLFVSIAPPVTLRPVQPAAFVSEPRRRMARGETIRSGNRRWGLPLECVTLGQSLTLGTSVLSNER